MYYIQNFCIFILPRRQIKIYLSIYLSLSFSLDTLSYLTHRLLSLVLSCPTLLCCPRSAALTLLPLLSLSLCTRDFSSPSTMLMLATRTITRTRATLFSLCRRVRRDGPGRSVVFARVPEFRSVRAGALAALRRVRLFAFPTRHRHRATRLATFVPSQNQLELIDENFYIFILQMLLYRKLHK